MKQNRIRKCLRAAALAVVALILVLAGTVFALWHNEFATLGSFRKLSDRDTAHHDGAVYELTVSGDYYFDDFLRQENIFGMIDHNTHFRFPHFSILYLSFFQQYKFIIC